MVGALKVRVGPDTWATIGGSSHIGEATIADGDKGDIAVTGGDWRVIISNDEAYNLRAGGAFHYTVPANSILGWFNAADGSFLLGKNLLVNYDENNTSRMHPDFLWDARALRLVTRNITLSMIADPADLNMRRWGPDQGGFPYGGVEIIDGPDGPEAHPIDGTFEDLTGLGIGALVSQVRSTPACVPYGDGNDQNTPGAHAAESNVVLAMMCSGDMPRQITDDGQTSVAGALEIALAQANCGDRRNIVTRFNDHGQVLLGIKACEVGDGGATGIVNIRTHEGRNTKQILTLLDGPTGGTFTIEFWPVPADNISFSHKVATAPIPYNASAAVVQAALEAIPQIGAGNVICATDPVGGALPARPVNIEFVGTKARTAQLKMATTDALTGTGPNPRAVIVRGPGVDGLPDQKTMQLISAKHTAGATGDYFAFVDSADANALTLTATKILKVGGAAEIAGAIDHNGSNAGFFGSAPVPQPANVTAATALVSLGLGATLVDYPIKVLNARTAAYTLALSDLGKTVTVDSATPVNLQVPAVASVPFVVGSTVDVIQLGVGQVTFIIGGASIINTSSPTKKMRAQYSVAHLIKTGTDTWVLSGDLATS